VSPDQLTLVTVTHNSERELAALLSSVERFLPGVATVVVDCASEDGSVALARARAGVTVIALGENLGFGRGCNRGVAAVETAVTVLVNPDVELLDDSLLGLGDEALNRPERLLAPLVLSTDGSRQETVHPAPCSVADLIRAVVPPAAVPGAVGLRMAPWRSRRPRRVGWAVGCALAAATDTLRHLGPFDERIFMYSEDLELGLRARQRGVETWFWPSGRVLHHGGHASYAAFGGEPFERQARARHDVVWRRLGPRAAAVDDAQQALTFASRIAYKRALWRPWTRERRQLQAVRAVRQASHGVR
jgi:GT2 family glycosyltransferase